jgi:hypothetical protein
MRAWLIALFALALDGGSESQASAAPATTNAGPLARAEAFIDAFYSFDLSRLRSAMADAAGSMGDTLYYQQWAEAGHYVVLNRKPCRIEKPHEAVCPVTVRDDLVPALGLSFHVTDNFHFKFRGGHIAKVWNSSDDPPQFHTAVEWLHSERPAIFTGPCRGMWEGGPTPKDCVRAIVKGFADYTAQSRPKV